MMKRMGEVKCKTVEGTINPACLQTTSATIAGNYIIINPATVGSINPALGTGEGQMVGAKIRTRSCTIRGAISMNKYNATTNTQMRPFYLKAWVCYAKNYPNLSPVLADWIGTSGYVFDEGTTDAGCTGNIIDMTRPINKRWLVLKGQRAWKIGNAVSGSGSGGTTPQYDGSNNDFSMTKLFKWNLTKHVDKTYTYESGATTWQNPANAIVFQVCAADGSTYAANQLPVFISYHLEYKYTDA